VESDRWTLRSRAVGFALSMHPRERNGAPAKLGESRDVVESCIAKP